MNFNELFKIALKVLSSYQTLIIGLITIVVLHRTLKTMEKNTEKTINAMQKSTMESIEASAKEFQISIEQSNNQERNKYRAYFDIDLSVLHLDEHQLNGTHRMHLDGSSPPLNYFGGDDIKNRTIKNNDLVLALYVTNKTNRIAHVLLDTVEILLESADETLLRGKDNPTTEINIRTKGNGFKPVIIENETLVITLVKLSDIVKFKLSPKSVMFNYINQLGIEEKFITEHKLLINNVYLSAQNKTRYNKLHKR